MSEPLTGSETGAVVITGIVVVFVILLILVGLCSLMSYLVNRKKKSPPVKKEEVPAPKPPAPAAAAKAPAAPVVESGISGEVVAAISAAVACMLGPDQKFAVRSVKRAKAAKGSRPVWSSAGIAENTRPF